MLWKDVTQNDSIPPNVCTVEALWVQQKVKWGWCKSLWPLCCTAASSHTRRTRSLHTCSSLCLWRPLVVDCGIGREQTASAGSSTSCCSVLPSFLLLLLLLAVTITIPAGPSLFWTNSATVCAWCATSLQLSVCVFVWCLMSYAGTLLIQIGQTVRPMKKLNLELTVF